MKGRNVVCKSLMNDKFSLNEEQNINEIPKISMCQNPFFKGQPFLQNKLYTRSKKQDCLDFVKTT